MRNSALSLFVAGLALLGSAMPGAAADPIKVGLVGPLSGPAAATGITVRKNYEYLARQINEAGGLEIEGEMRKIEVLAEDSRSKPDVGVAAAQKLLVRDQVDVLVGDLLHSSVALALMEVSASFNTKPFYVPLPTSSTISQRIADNPEKYGHIWKWDVDNEAHVVTLHALVTRYAEEKNLAKEQRKFALIIEDTDFSKNIISPLLPLLQEDGWTMVAEEIVAPAHTDFYPQISKVSAQQPAIVVTLFSNASSGLAVVRQLAEQKSTAKHLAAYYPSLAEFKAANEPAAVGIEYNGILVDESKPRLKAFADEMREQDITPSSDALLGHCSAQTLFDAIRRAGSVEVAKVNQAMLDTDATDCPSGIRFKFDPVRHAPLYGPEYFSISGIRIMEDGSHRITWPPAE